MIKVLTIRQPWAGLIITGLKNIENRSWSTNFRGRLLIHAGKRNDAEEWKGAELRCKKLGLEFPNADPILSAYGAILGYVFFDEIIPPTDRRIPWYTPQYYGWVLRDPHRLDPPIPAKGMPGLWNLPPDIKIDL